MSARVPAIRGPMGAFGNVGDVSLPDEDADVNDKPVRVDYNQMQQQQQYQQPRRKQPGKQQPAGGPPAEMLQLVGNLDGDYGDQQNNGFDEEAIPPPKRRVTQQPVPRQRARAPSPEPQEGEYEGTPDQATQEPEPEIELTPTQYFDIHVKKAKVQMVELAESLATTQEMMRKLKNTFALLEKTPMGVRAVKPRPPTSNVPNGRPKVQQEHDF